MMSLPAQCRTYPLSRVAAAQQYGGFKAVDKLFAPPERKSIVGRWDWHFWQFLLALIPPGAVVLLVKWARDDMAKKEQARQQKAAAEMMAMLDQAEKLRGQRAARAEKPAEQSAEAASEGQPAGDAQEVKRRLAELEAAVKELAAKQAGAAAAGEAVGMEHALTGASPLPPQPTEAAAAAPGGMTHAAPAAGAAPAAAAAPSAAGAAGAQHPPGKVPPLPKLPDNPLDRWLPETDCQFCNDTRQQLWGAFKAATGLKTTHGKAQAAQQAQQAKPSAEGAKAGQQAPVAAEGTAAAGPTLQAPYPPSPKEGEEGKKELLQASPEEGVGHASSEAGAADASSAVLATPHAAEAAGGSAALPAAGAAGPEPGVAAEAPPTASPQAAPATASAQQQETASSPAASPTSAAAASADGSSSGGSKQGSNSNSASRDGQHPSDKAPPLPKLPDNPLDRWLPETDCQFCNDTRQRLWGAFKATTGYKSAYDREQERQGAAAAGAAQVGPK